MQGDGQLAAEMQASEVEATCNSVHSLLRGDDRLGFLPSASVSVSELTIVVDVGQCFEDDRNMIEIALIGHEQKKLILRRDVLGRDKRGA